MVGRGLAGFVLVLFSILPVGGQEKGWEKEWQETLAAAKKEGKVVVASGPDPTFRNEIIPKFMSRFGIPVEFLALRGAEIAGRLRTERQAGIYSIDVHLANIGTAATILYPEEMLDPLKPMLFLPEVVEPAKWKKGKLRFVDPKERYVLRVFSSVNVLLHINADYVKPEEIRSTRDLLDPRWTGRISVDDPTVTGRGAAQAAFLYSQLGEEFFKRLYADQKPAISRDRRQVADWLARGTYPICLGCREDDVKALRKEGFKILEVFDLSDIRPRIAGAPWALQVANRAPHPNAARVFANWIVSREGLEIYSRGWGSATLRSDVDESFLDARIVPPPGVKHFDSDDWNHSIPDRERIRLRIKDLLKRH